VSNYEVGRDIQELRSRIERLEGFPFGGPGTAGTPEGRHGLGRIAVAHEAGIHPDKKPIVWKPKAAVKLEPFLYGLLGVGSRLQFDVMPESQTWGCVPEPLIVNVTWSDGSTQEHFRFVNQVFSVIRVSDPNTHVTTATFIYSAQQIGANGSSIDYAGGYQGPPYVPSYYAGPSLFFTLRSSGGAGLFSYSLNFSVPCHANQNVTLMHEFPPGLYDLVAGANWQFNSWSVARC
jgi:hypothetical protein